MIMGQPKLVIEPLSSKAQALYDAICAKGYAPHELGGAADLRDAAHEAHHALFCNLKKPWTRDNIHASLVRRANKLRQLANGELVAYELDARAVEWNVCELFNVAYDVERWADITWWETAKNMRITLPKLEWLVEQITARKVRPRTQKFVDAVLALAPAENGARRLTPDELSAAAGETCKTCGRPREGHRYRHPFRAVKDAS